MSTITNVTGYLEYDYATRPYLQGLIEIADGLQFQSFIQDARAPVAMQTTFQIAVGEAYGLQFQARITQTAANALQWQSLIEDVEAPQGLQAQAQIAETLANAMQFQSAITTAYGVGVQFEANNTAQTLVGAQFQGLITESYPAALQFQGERTEESTHGFQFQHKRVEAYAAGLQFQSDVTQESPIGVELRAQNGWIHRQCGPGYLEEFGYLEDWPYLAPRICVTGAMQFEGVGKRQNFYGLQFQGLITKQQSYGVQFQGKIYTSQPVGLQVEAITITPVGMQVRVAIYNTTNLRIMYDFPSRGETGTNWTASGTAASSTNAFSVNNLNTDIVEQVWRSDGSPSVTLTCDTQRTGGVFVDTIAILNHNLSGGATVEVQFSDNNITYSTYANMNVEQENMYYIAPNLPLEAHRYWRFVINDTGNFGIQIGTIVFGSSIIFQGECFIDTVRFGKRQFKDQVFTEGHTNVSNDRGKKRFLGLEFTDLNFGKANFRQLRNTFNDVGTILKALWIPTPQTPSRFAIFGKLEEIPEETHNTRGEDYVSLSIRVDESL